MAAPDHLSKLRRAYHAVAVFFLNVCLLFLLANLVAAVILASRTEEAAEPRSDHVHAALRAAYPNLDADELAQLRRESARTVTREALVQHREEPYAGRFVTIDPGGFRHGANQGPWPPDPKFTNVFVFGGSTAFGYGVADQDTISSYLQDELSGAGLSREPRVYNFARGAFYSTQERLLFTKLLAVGVVPDFAIFIDGLNDFYFPRDPAPLTLGLTQLTNEEFAHPLRAFLRRLPVLQLLEGRARNVGHEPPERAPQQPPGRAPASDDAALLDGVIRRYVANKRIIEALADAHDVGVAFVWQPVPTYGYDLRRHIYSGDFGPHETSRRGYPRMREFVDEKPLGKNFLWCADIHPTVEGVLYVDEVHYSPILSAHLAACIAEGLRDAGLMG